MKLVLINIIKKDMQMDIGHIKMQDKQKLMIFCTATTNRVEYYFPKWI